MKEVEKSSKYLNEKGEDFPKASNNTFFFDLYNDIYSMNITKNESNDKLIINAKLENNINDNFIYYENSFSLKDLIKKSKPFKLCDTIDESLNIFLDILKAKKASLNKENEDNNNDMNNKLLFIVKISFPGGQEQNAEFELFQKQMNKDEYINKLIKIIERLKKENEELKYKNSIQENEINSLKNKLFNKYEIKNINNKMNKSFDTKKNFLNSGTFNSNYNSFFKYGYNDIHSSNDINNIINCHTLYNSNNINLNKLDNNIYKNENNNIRNTDNYFFQNSMSSFKRGKLTKNSNNSNHITNKFSESKNIPDQEHLKETQTNTEVKKINFIKPKKKKKEILLNNVIYIKNYLNKVTMIPIEEYMSIKQIKTRYCSKKFIHIKGKELYYKGIKLDDEKNLEFYNIPWESTLYVLNIPEKINVYVRSLSGKEFKIIADELMTILKIKFKIYELENIPVDKQLVLKDKKILDDDRNISEFNINGDVHLLVRRKDE